MGRARLLAGGLWIAFAAASAVGAEASAQPLREGDVLHYPFDVGQPSGVRVANAEVRWPAAGADGNSCLRLLAAADPQGPPLLVLPLPDDANFPRSGHLRCLLRGVAGQDLRLRWFALDEDNWVLFQRPFRISAGMDWQAYNGSLLNWRWGDRHVGDWSRVRALALRVEQGPSGVDLDELSVQPGDVPLSAAGDLPEQWLQAMAFAGREIRVAIGEDMLICTDAVDALDDEDVADLAAQVLRVQAWLRRRLAPALRPRQDGTPVKLFVFRRRASMTRFFRQLGRQWGCRIAVPDRGGVTVQDISACCFGDDDSVPEPVALHEAVHAMAAHELALSPSADDHSWLHEGMANYLQMAVFPDSFPRSAMRRHFDEGVGPESFFRPLSELVHVRVQASNYAQLASLVAYLIDERPDWLHRIVTGLAQGMAVEDVLTDLGTDLDEVQRLWLQWGRGSKWLGGPSGGHFPLPREWRDAPAQAAAG